MEQEKRKRNIVVFNLKTSQAGDTSQSIALFEHLTGSKPSEFCSGCIGKPNDDKAQPVLVEFASELDQVDILRSAQKLKDLQAE